MKEKVGSSNISKVAKSFVTSAPFENQSLQRALGIRSYKFSSPYWLTVKTLKRLKVPLKPKERKLGTVVDMGNVPYNVKRMPSRFTLTKRISNFQLAQKRSRSDFRVWYNIEQTKCPDKLKSLVGKSHAFDGVDGRKIANRRMHQALVSVASKYSSCYWISQDDARELELATKDDIQPVAISLTSNHQQSSGMVQRMKSSGIFLPTLSQSNIQTTMFYNLDHFVDQKTVQRLRALYPYKVWMGVKQFYSKTFSLELLKMALEKNYTSPLWFTPTRITKREFKIKKDEYHQITSSEGETRFYNRCVLSGHFNYEDIARFEVHMSLFHRIKLPEAFYFELNRTVKKFKYTSNYWVADTELQELGLYLLPDQSPTRVRSGHSQTTVYQLYNIQQTKPLKSR